nr:MAG TPA: hypothetical protein [Caudoviricetes sp.]
MRRSRSYAASRSSICGTEFTNIGISSEPKLNFIVLLGSNKYQLPYVSPI